MFSVIFMLFFIVGVANGAKVKQPSSTPVKPTVKPVAKPVPVPVSKPTKVPVVKPTKPKPSPAINTVWSNTVANFNTFYPINGTIGTLL